MPVRIHEAVCGVVFCLSGCAPIVQDGVTQATHYANYVPRPLQPENCGTPDHYKDCIPGGMRPLAVAQARSYVTIEELGGGPTAGGDDAPRGEASLP
jgi:hypothetical protein